MSQGIDRRGFAGGAAGLAVFAGTKAGAGEGPAGRWLAEDIRGGGVVDRIQTVLDIAGDGRVSGSGGCNRIAGQARIEGPAISFSQMASTRMACPPAVMDQEMKFLSALGEVRRWRIDGPRRKLILEDGNGAVLVVLARHAG
ncbi:META domain-containing protein [Phreatobacter sp.]|uniref:META domain-containing protein n=1 Tax=Phreatobacter sp. TaxID=1966341 RepID=UPI003F7061D1